MCGMESNVLGNQMWHRVHHSIARDSRGWPWMSRTLTVAFPARILRWGYLSQGKGSISSKLDPILLPPLALEK